MIRKWIQRALAAFLIFISASAAVVAEGFEEPKETPNVIVILADDLGYGDVGCYNPESRIPTPNLDRMAKQGIKFTDAHSPCTVCTPTRYSLMTGRMAFRTPRGGRVFSGAGGPSLIEPGEFTLPMMLRDKGYSTACFGKWHIGLTFYDSDGQPIHKGGLQEVSKIDYEREIDGGPIDCGFDEFFGTACCPTTDWLYAYIDGKKIPNPPTKQLDKSTLPDHPYSKDNRRGMQADDFDLEEVDMLFLEKSQQFLRKHVEETPDKPFFLFHSTQAVHLPSFPGKEFKGKTDSGPHGDFIFELDYVVGELFKTLDELDVADNTIVIFTSDNGPEVPSVINMRKDHGHDGARPWRGVKRDNWEGGHRVPFIVRWPGKIEAGSQSNQITSLTDVFATIAEIVDYDIPAEAAADSFSMLPAYSGTDDGKPIRPYILQQGFGGKKYLAIRKGRWKYLAHQGSGGNRYHEETQMHPYQLPELLPDALGQLYDLQTDPGETTNLSDKHPEIVKELTELLKKTMDEGRSVPPKSKVESGKAQPDQATLDRPNVLWLSTEDIGPHLGCYGDTVARTPNLDALAKRGVVYDHAWSNYPVCAPARTTLITGVYASSMAAGHMRCGVPLDSDLRMFPQYLREAGYYCTNRSKEDYNVFKPDKVWDESSKKAHYRNRPAPSQSFFAVLNQTCTHESKIRKRPHNLITDPASIVVPPYHPDLPEVRHDWAQYYDNIATLDQWVGQQLKKLEESGQAEDTIVVFFGDHGSGMPRHKRYAGNSGMHVPLIVFVPEKWQAKLGVDFETGSHSKRLVSFVDFAPTMLSLAGVEPPVEMQGRAFLGQYAVEGPDHLLGFRSRMDERIDCSRSACDGRYVYIRNYMPHLPHGQFIDYQQATPTTASWNQMYRDGTLNEIQAAFWSSRDFEELYDLKSDPHETKNLAQGNEEDLPPATAAVLARMRQALNSHQNNDVELLPETLTASQTADRSAFDMRTENSTIYEFARKAADTTSRNRSSLLEQFEVLERSSNSIENIAQRHWASVGVLIRGEQAVKQAKDKLIRLLNDEVPTVRVNVAEALATFGDEADQKVAMETLVQIADMTQSDYPSAIWALNAIDRLGDLSKPYRDQLSKLSRTTSGVKRGGQYVSDLLQKITQQE
jgi:arylsulfatase A-like enzyme